jgi:hypothetical protein
MENAMPVSRKKTTRTTRAKTPSPPAVVPDDNDDGRGRLVELYDPTPDPHPLVEAPRPAPDPVKTLLSIRDMPVEERRWLIRKLAEHDPEWLGGFVIMYKHEEESIRDVFTIAIEGLSDLGKKLRSRNSCVYSKRAKTAERVTGIETAMKSGLKDWNNILEYMKEHHVEAVKTKERIISAKSLQTSYSRAKKPK